METPDTPDRPRPPLGVTLRRLVVLARPYRVRLAGAIALLLVATSVGLVVPLGLKELLDSVFTQEDRALLNRVALGLLGLFALQAALGAVGGYWLDWTGERVVSDLRQRLYTHLHRLGLRFSPRRAPARSRPASPTTSPKSRPPSRTTSSRCSRSR